MHTADKLKIKGIATLMLACSIGIGAGFSRMVGAAEGPDSPAPQSNSPDAVPNEPGFEPGARQRLDRSGRPRVGKASFYANRYSGKKMADGTPMHLYSNNAASITLPLGTTAKVTNLETGKSAIITIRDRGPYVKGRIVDLSPATARLIGLSSRKGIALVEVTPVSLPATS